MAKDGKHPAKAKRHRKTTAPDPDQRFKIDADPEDALRVLLSTPPVKRPDR